ncbi:MAG: hypothetical protein HYX83_02700 [Chloroflexi bacterium]|nr:hypothetical protein [Chloroflexota bacterium]
MSPTTIKVLKPTGEGKRSETEIARRIDDLNGKTIGLLDDGKPNFDVFLARVEERLKERYQFAAVVRARKGAIAGAKGLELNEIERLAKCDAVINGMCD